ncbi:DUF2877 domain-containing protein [Bacillus sp. 1P06AnD]|uniref:DUF2877 domain-containing protein n=1 Tax=Bacillus sp. 1P06AnD TaxID=3132208 RepID=UPI0039A0A5B9
MIQKITTRAAVGPIAAQLVKGRQYGHIHSIFHNCFNIMIGDQLIYFGNKSHFDIPFGVMLDDAAYSLLSESVKVGEVVVFHPGKIMFYGSTRIKQLTFLELKERSLSIPKIDLTVLELYQAYAQLEDWMRKGHVEKKTGLSFSLPLEFNRYFSEDQRRLWQLIDTYVNKENSAEGAVYFLGRGIGLTPSGDDLVTGLMVVLQAFGEDVELPDGYQTTAVSNAYLHAAGQGFATSILIEVVHSLQGKNLLKKCGELVSFGHSSGYDTLFGLLAALQIVIHKKEGGLTHGINR